ncbi:MAG TPA: DUF3795 domain-containing protein [Candidatus Sumerlaeota bacterium]|nr:DUF3795 domain-containing protein [Candidatus Sumerlaeota bacterium]
MIACCGLDCEKCEALIATEKNDDALRAEVAGKWSELYHVPIQPGDINCTGCRSDGVKVYYCDHMCEIRKCSMGKGLENCAPCSDYPCANLNEVFKMAPHARAALDALRA